MAGLADAGAAVVLFTRDLRIHDHPALHRARAAAGGSTTRLPWRTTTGPPAG